MINGELIVDNFARRRWSQHWHRDRHRTKRRHFLNHDPKAIAQHRANHPSTKHYCESVWDVDPVKACGGHPVALVRVNLPELCKAVRLPICRPDRIRQEANGQMRFA